MFHDLSLILFPFSEEDSSTILTKRGLTIPSSQDAKRIKLITSDLPG